MQVIGKKTTQKYKGLECTYRAKQRNIYYGLVVKALDSQSRGPVFKTTGWFQGRLSLSSFQGQ